MKGWNLKAGAITEYVVSEDRIWSLFNFVFSDACKKRNTYKFGLIKSLLDSAFSGEMTEQGVRYSYEELFVLKIVPMHNNLTFLIPLFTST